MPKSAARMIKEHKVTENDQIVCPYCHEQGHVTMRQEKVKQGFSPGKVVAMICTAGLSLLVTGLAKKVWVTQLTCGNCSMKWQA